MALSICYNTGGQEIICLIQRKQIYLKLQNKTKQKKTQKELKLYNEMY